MIRPDQGPGLTRREPTGHGGGDEGKGGKELLPQPQLQQPSLKPLPAGSTAREQEGSSTCGATYSGDRNLKWCNSPTLLLDAMLPDAILLMVVVR